MPAWLAFFARFLRDRRHVGAVLPSGRALARAVAHAVGPLANGAVIVELGPGTGALTEELVRAFPRARLLLVERDPAFVGTLRAQFPLARVVAGDAADLEGILEQEGVRPATAVSGLPMLSLPESMRKAVFSALGRVLPTGARYVQFTYGPAAWRRMAVPGFRLASQRRVWGNVPPAAVLTFERT